MKILIKYPRKKRKITIPVDRKGRDKVNTNKRKYCSRTVRIEWNHLTKISKMVKNIGR